MSGALAVVGVLLIATGAVIAVADTGRLSDRMPTQVPPRRLARYPVVAGVALLAIGVVGLVIP